MSDLISRRAAIDVVDSETVSTNPEHFKSSEKFIKFMDDADIASFGKWQWANGFNTALTATTIQLKNLPSAEPVRKGEWLDYTCMNWHGWHCSECDYETQKKTRYCPNCGAFMSEGETDD